MLIPISTTILKEKLPKNAPIVDEKKYAEEFGKDLDNRITFIYPYDTMRSHKDEYVYYKTDHHWTTLGAYYTYEEFWQSVRLDKKNLDEYTKILATDQFMEHYIQKAYLKLKRVMIYMCILIKMKMMKA